MISIFPAIGVNYSNFQEGHKVTFNSFVKVHSGNYTLVLKENLIDTLEDFEKSYSRFIKQCRIIEQTFVDSQEEFRDCNDNPLKLTITKLEIIEKI